MGARSSIGIGVARLFTGVGNVIQSLAAGVTPLTVKGASGQTADLLVVKDSDGNNHLSVNFDGRVTQNVSATTGPSHETRKVQRWVGGADGNGVIDYINVSDGGYGVHTILASGDSIWQIRANGSDGSAFREAARITVTVDGTPGASDMPGAIFFSTTADGASSPTERLRINNAGRIILGGTSGPQIIVGTGSPESAVTAPVGSIYLRTDGGAGTTLYVKQSGTGNTGWAGK